VGGHAGISVGPDGATHQMLEDIALMRVLPNMLVVVPCDSLEAEKATLAVAAHNGPSYLRSAREKTPIVTTTDTPFLLGKAQVFRPGTDLTIIACGPLVYQSLLAAEQLSKHGLEAEVINCPVIKPLDQTTILTSVRKTGAVITAEEAQVAGGLAGTIAELLGEHHPVPMARIGLRDHFGESGTPAELMEKFGLTAPNIVKVAHDIIKRKG
jgi:transketolase